LSPTGKLLAGGSRMAGGNNGDWMLAQFDLATGDVDWTDYYDTSGFPGEFVCGVGVDAAGAWWVCGFAHATFALYGVLTRRYDATGVVLSSAPWYPPAGLAIYDLPADALHVGSAGEAWEFANVYGTGGNSSIAMLEFDAAGTLVLEDYFGGSFGTHYGTRDSLFSSSDRMALTGYVQSNPSGATDFVTPQLDMSQLPTGYCTAKTTSTGCEPFASFTGMSSASASSGFAVRAGGLRNQKSGLLFYGLTGSASAPFQGGTMCIATPRMRTPVQSSGGNSFPADDCSGSFALDMNAFAGGALGGAPAPALRVAGTTVHCQFWGRDPGFAPPQNTMLSSALRYVVLP